MQDAKGLAQHVVNHLVAVGPKTMKTIVVAYADGTEVRGFATHASAMSLTISDEHTGNEVPIHFARVERAEVHHYDGTVVTFE